MRATLLPEVFFNLREIVKVIPVFHVMNLPLRAVLAFYFFRRSVSRCIRRCLWVCRRTMVAIAMLILVPDNAQAVQSQELIDMLNMFGAARHQSCLSARRHHRRVCLHLGLHARQHAVNHIYGAIIKSCLHVRDGVCADYLPWILDFHARLQTYSAYR